MNLDTQEASIKVWKHFVLSHLSWVLLTCRREKPKATAKCPTMLRTALWWNTSQFTVPTVCRPRNLYLRFLNCQPNTFIYVIVRITNTCSPPSGRKALWTVNWLQYMIMVRCIKGSMQWVVHSWVKHIEKYYQIS